MAMGRLKVCALFSILAFGCGGAPPESSGPATAADPPSTAAAPSASEAPAPPPAPSSDAKSLDEHKKSFLASCNTTPGLDAYCDCSWTTFTKQFSAEDMNQSGDPPPDKLAAFKKAVVDECADKMPESMLQDGFVRGCTQGRDGFDEYCKCSWPALRKEFSAQDLARAETATSDKFAQAMQRVSKQCAAKLPAKVLEDSFMEGCLKKGPDLKPFCGCAWKKMKASLSPADIALGPRAPGFKSSVEKVQKACHSFMPKQ